MRSHRSLKIFESFLKQWEFEMDLHIIFSSKTCHAASNSNANEIYVHEQQRALDQNQCCLTASLLLATGFWSFFSIVVFSVSSHFHSFGLR